MNTKSLTKLDFELAYLSVLTLEGLKPLSRWEKNFDHTTEETLQNLGLKTRVVARSVQSGQRLRELLFSSTDECLALYGSRFADKPIDRSRDNLRIEGLLFGYPSCCVESYAARGYAANALRRRDQRILFHWACPGCAITPSLLPHYRRVYRACRSSKYGRILAVLPADTAPSVTRHLRRAVAMAASLATLGTLPLAVLSGHPEIDSLDPHIFALPLADDPDADFLATGEEMILGLNARVFDENTNAVPDGVDLARALSVSLAALPTTPSLTNAYMTHHPMFGVETCQVCGTNLNMGTMTICNPLENQTSDVPYIAQHFLEHGSFSYSGTLHSGRINPALLELLLTSLGQGHFIAEPAGSDADNDGLRQWEEPAFGTDPAQADTDGDQLLDGVDAARELRRALGALPRTAQPDRPYVLERLMFGFETCPACGESWTMGSWEVINPLTGDSITVPTMALHHLEHGAFQWRGGQLFGGEGRVDPRQLQAVLSGKANRHLLPVSPDRDGDLLSDSEEQAIGKHPAVADEDGNAVRDGLDLARATAAEIAALPTKTHSNQVYRLDFPLLGVERCDICGTNVNMGHLTVFNPAAHRQVEVPYIALHYLEHDSFSYAGDVHGTGRIDLKQLWNALLQPAVVITTGESTARLRWSTRAGYRYQVFTAPEVSAPWTPGPVFVGDGSELSFNEDKAPGAARKFYKIVASSL